MVDAFTLEVDAFEHAGSTPVTSNLLNPQAHYTPALYRYANMAKKQSSSSTSTLAGKILSGSKKPTTQDAKKLAASVLSQDEKKGQQKKPR